MNIQLEIENKIAEALSKHRIVNYIIMREDKFKALVREINPLFKPSNGLKWEEVEEPTYQGLRVIRTEKDTKPDEIIIV